MMRHVNQLQFNLDIPTKPGNMRTDFTSPSAIVFERILPNRHATRQQRSGSPVRMSVLSNSKLSKALQLAKRDLKLAKRKKTLQTFAKENQMNIPEVEYRSEKEISSQLNTKNAQTKYRRQHQISKSPQKSVYVKRDIPKLPKHDQEILEIKRLRFELRQHIYTLEQNMQDNGRMHQQKLLLLDHEEEQRLVVRHLEQMRKSSRTVYALQQQVQVIKDELGKNRNISPKQDRTMARLAAVHRGSVRLMQVYSTQLSEHLIFHDNFVAVNALYQEVSRLVKELYLCSLQLDLTNIEEVEKISDILKKIEPKYTPRSPSPKPERRPRSPAKQQKTPQRSFKSKQITLVKKSLVHPKHIRHNTFAQSPTRSRNQSNEPRGRPDRDIGQQEMTDIFDRPEWIPPSNSPRKNVGPPPLSPLLESPTPSQRYKPRAVKQVKFFSTPNERNKTEHDIELSNGHFHHGTPRDLKILKNQIAAELETELRDRINPLLQKVEKLANSALSSKVAQSSEENILENQVRDIIDETRKEMKNFQKKKDLEKEAVNLYQGPSIETLMQRLDTINKEEETIRRRWQEINYHDTKPNDPMSSRNRRDSAPTSPEPIKFTRTGSQIVKEPEKKIVNFLPHETIKYKPTVKKIQRDQIKVNKPFTGRTLMLPQSTINAIKRNKNDYERHLKFTFHESKGNFDPWRLVEEISDNVLEEVITSVTQEVNEMCEDYANDIFQREFADAPFSTESSLLTSDNSSLLTETTPKRP